MLGGDSVKTVWIEASPVLPAREEDDGYALVAEVLHNGDSLRVFRDIPLHKRNLQVVKSLFGEAARKAPRGREDSDH